MRRLFLLVLGLATCAVQVITTVAGSGGSLGDNGAATSAALNEPSGVAVDSAGNIYIADHQDQRVRRVDSAGIITTFAGTGTRGFSGDGGPASSAALTDPYGVAVDSGGNVYIADRLNYRVRKVTPAGIITTVAGAGTAGFSGDGGPSTSASISSPQGLALDTAGNLYIGETGTDRVREVTPAGIISTVAGGANIGGNFGDGGLATNANLSLPIGVTTDSTGNLFIADSHHGRIRKVSASPGAAAISASATSLSFTYTIGGAVPASQPLTVTSSTGPLTVTASTSGGSWLSVTPLAARLR